MENNRLEMLKMTGYEIHENVFNNLFIGLQDLKTINGSPDRFFLGDGVDLYKNNRNDVIINDNSDIITISERGNTNSYGIRVDSPNKSFILTKEKLLIKNTNGNILDNVMHFNDLVELYKLSKDIRDSASVIANLL
jgi:hypothetical protein|nr:MAG TPA: hypothetical protein [Bacteriophage sp.]